MKKVFNFATFAAFIAFFGIATSSFAATTVSLPYPTFNPQGIVLVEAGTPISLQLNANLDSDDLEVGNTINFTVSFPVVVDGQTVVNHGAVAKGKITKLKRLNRCTSCETQYQSMEIAVTQIAAVDGSWIQLNGTPHAIRANCPTCSVQVSQGIDVQATVLSTVRVKTR